MAIHKLSFDCVQCQGVRYVAEITFFDQQNQLMLHRDVCVCVWGGGGGGGGGGAARVHFIKINSTCKEGAK